MSWTRLDDLWTDDPTVNQLTFEDRWHYLAMIQFCSRTRTFEGLIRYVNAMRCSDHPNPDVALKNMHALGLVTIDGAYVKLNRLEEHIPPPSIRDNAKNTQIRMRRKRKHLAGDHSECLSRNCEKAVTRNVTAPATRNARTGQDRTGSLTQSSTATEKRESEKLLPEAIQGAEGRTKAVPRPTSVPAGSASLLVIEGPQKSEEKLNCPGCTDPLQPDGTCLFCSPRKPPLPWVVDGGPA